ncbi:MAG: hypothetical protein A2W23_06070 [Planctomycetes bacterium RBG_16_43_13]|nr:MAG: hypothetical protein A2W23_06070 [Planctomycetes bacterium RBG_16_43_13]
MDLRGPHIVTQWKGMLVVKNAPLQIIQPRSRKQVKSWLTLTEISRRWYGVLSELQRAKWEAAAKMLGSAALQEKRMITTGAGNIIKNRRGVLMSGCHYYVRGNILAAASGMAYPRDEAPLATSMPPAPQLVRMDIDTSHNKDVLLICNILCYGLSEYVERKLRVWLHIQSHGLTRKGLIETVTDAVETSHIAFSGFRGDKSFGKDWVKFSELDGGCVRAQAEVVVADSPNHGAVRSAPSNLAEQTLPLQPNNPEADDMREQIRAIKREASQRYYYRKRGLQLLASQIGELLMRDKNRDVTPKSEALNSKIAEILSGG